MSGVGAEWTLDSFLKKLGRAGAADRFRLVCLVSLDGIVVECSAATLEQAGLAERDVVGRPLWSTMWWDASPAAAEDVRQAVLRAARGNFARCDVLARVEKNSTRTVLVDLTVALVQSDEGSVPWLLIEARDVMAARGEVSLTVRGTELLTNDTPERHRQKIARIALDSMVQFVGLLDAEGTVLEINQVALDAVGIKLSDVEGRPFWTTFWWQVSEEINFGIRDSIRRAAQGEFVRWDTEIYGRAGGKETIVIDASLMPVKDESGKVVFIAAEGRDITEKKAYEREIARQREELAKLDVLKTQFFANVSHEFRTPLTLILGPLEDALSGRNGALPEAVSDGLATSHRNALRLLKLVNTMLDFSRIEAGRAQALYEATDLAEYTAELASNFRSLCERAGLRLHVDCPPLPEPVYVDRDMWEKIVLNLLSNAFKFTLDGEIDVRLEMAERSAQLTVRDTGVGIPREELPHMFERFHRIERNRGRTHEGTGIGLALVKELVRLHGGTIAVDSVFGQGSTFTVTIPGGKAHLDGGAARAADARTSTTVAPAAFVEEASRWLPDQAGLSGEVQMPQRSAKASRILWADDNADMRAYVSRLLGDRYQVQAVADGEAALEAARAQPPDLILTDVMMPKLDGYGLLQALRGDPYLRDIPVILLSARAGEESRIEGITAGADDYLVKPFSANELMARVDTALQLRRVRNQARSEVEGSEQRFRAFVTATSDVIYQMSPDWSEMRQLVGRDFIADTTDPSHSWMERYIHPDDHAMVSRAIAEAVQGKTMFELEHRVIRVDGSLGWTHSRAVPRFNADGEVMEWFGTARDVTEHKASDQAIARLTAESEHQRRLYEAIVSSTPDLVYIFDRKHRFVYANDALLKMWGKTSEEALGKTCLELGYEPWHAEMHDREIEEVVSSRRPIRGDVPFNGTGGPRIYDYIFVPVVNAKGEVELIAGTTRDVTERKLIEQELRRVNQDLEQFAYSASHDLKEPLRTVKIYSELLNERYRKNLDGAAFDFLENIRNGADRMEALVRDLLAYTQTSLVDKPTEPTDAMASLEAALANLEAAIAESGGLVQADALPRVAVHATQLQSLFQNLVGNALKYRRPQVAPVIKITARRQDGIWLFCVADNGIGIEPAFREQIFGLFKRLHTSDEYTGTGIGLAICKRIVEQYHGRIWVESEAGEGCRFYFTLPG